MTTPLAKIVRPRATEVYLRERLFTQLDVAAEKPVIWITAPAGAGKTTLVTSWLDTRNSTTLWYQVDEGDADLATFFYYLGEAARQVVPLSSKTLPLLTPEYLQGVSVFSRRYFESLFSLLDVPSTVVFDNYQELPDGFGFHEMMTHALDVIPVGIQVVILSRSEPPPQFSRLMANSCLQLVTWDDLRFTRQETDAFLDTQGIEKLPVRTLALFYEKSAGWAAGLVLLTARTKLSGTEPETLELQTPREIFDYFAHEIFRKVDQNLQEILLQTAYLRKVEPQIAEQLTGINAAGLILEKLCRDNFFTQKYDLSYQYHPLFREFLLARAYDRFSPEESAAIRIKAAALLAETGQGEEAAELFIDAADWEGLIQLIITRASELVAQGRWRTLAGWLDKVPSEFVERTPWLLYWKGVSRLYADPYDARNCLVHAFDQFKAQGELSGMLNAWAIISDTLLYGWGERRERWIHEFDEIRAVHPVFPSRELELRTTVSMFHMVMLWTTLREDLPEWEARVTAISAQCSNQLLYMQLNHLLMIYHLWIGDFNKAGVVLRAMGKPESDPDEEPLAHLLWYDSQAMYAWVAADHHACFDAVRKGLALSDRTGVHIMDPYLNKYGISAAVSLGYSEFANELIRKYAERPKLNTMSRAFYHYLSSLAAWGTGDNKHAIEDAKQTLAILNDLDYRIGAYCTHMLLTVAYYDEGEFEKAAYHLKRSFERATEGSYLKFIVLVFMARAALDCSNRQEAIQLLGRGFEIGARQGFMNFAYWRNGTMSKLCVLALEQGIETNYVRQLIQLHAMTPPHGAADCPDWPWPVKIYTLGRFELLVDSKPVAASGTAPSKPLQLLTMLIASGGTDVAQDQLADLLWPDAEGDQARRSFDTTLHRLRRMLGNDRALFIRNGKLSLDSAVVWLDLRLFDTSVENLIALVKDGGVTPDSEHAYRTVLALYKGCFMPADTTAAWSMACLLKLDRQAEALAVFDTCRHYLLASRGVEPSLATTTLMQTICNSLTTK